MASDGVIVLDPKDQHSTFCIGKAGPIAGNLITHLATIAGLLLTRRTVKQRGTYQESCPLGVLELSTTMNLTSI
jgi:hypothetical protein